MQGVILKSGSHKFTLTVSESGKDKKRNRISDIGLTLPGINGNVKVVDRFAFVKVTIVKVVRSKGRLPRVVRKIIKVPKSATVKDLKNVLRKTQRSVKKIIISLKVKKLVKVRLNVKGCVEKKPVTVTTRITTRRTTIKSFIYTTSSIPDELCKSFEDLMVIPDYLTVSSTPFLKLIDIESLRFTQKRYSDGSYLRKGDYVFEITAPIGESFSISDFGLHLFGISDKTLTDSILSKLNVVVTRIISNYCQIVYMSPTMKISRTITLKDLKSLLKKKVTNVHQVIITFKLLKDVRLKIKVFGCKELQKPIKKIFYKKRCRKNLFKIKNMITLNIKPQLEKAALERLTKASEFGKGGLLLKKGVHSLLITFSSARRKRILEKVTETGIILLKKNEEDQMTKYFKYVKLIISKTRTNIDGNRQRIKETINIPQNARIKDLKDMLVKLEKGIRYIKIIFKVKTNITIRLNVKGCAKKIKGIQITEGSTIPYSAVNEQTIKCQKVYNMIKSKKYAHIQTVPAQNPQGIKNLRFDSRKPQVGTILKKGRNSIQISVPGGKTITLVNLGLVFASENQNSKASTILRNLVVVAFRSRISFGRTIYIPQTLTIPKNLKIKELRNLLKTQIVNFSKATITFTLLKNVKTSVRLAGCGTKSTKLPKGTTIITTPYSAVNEQTIKCQKVYNLIKSKKDADIQTVPAQNPQGIKKLRFDSRKPQVGTILKKGRNSIQISVPGGKTITLVNLGLVFASENQNSKASTILRNLVVIASRSRISFGRTIYIPQTLTIPKNLKIKDLRNILKTQIVNFSKVTIEFTLQKNVKTSIKLNGCQPFISTKPTDQSTTLPSSYGIINGQNNLCLSTVNLLPFSNLATIEVTPNITDLNLIKLKSKGKKYFPGAEFLKSSYILSVQLPQSQGATITQFGFEFPLEKQKLNLKTLLSSLDVEITRMRISFGNVIYTTVKVSLPKVLKIEDLRNLLSQQFTQINRIVVRFTLLKKANVRLILNGCYSYVPRIVVTQKPVGCLHLNKYYAPNDLIVMGLKCDYRLCLDGEVLPIFQCHKKWTEWKQCSKPCGAGQSTRRQICVFNPKLKNIDKKALMAKVDETCFEKLEVKPCFEKPCEVSCKLSTWSSWSPCDNSKCKDEFQVRRRMEVTNPKHTQCTEPLIESRRCIKPNCSCVENAEMNSCANLICPTNCDHINDRVKCVKSQTGCIKACVCKLGYLYQYGKCVPKSKCECLKPIFKGWLQSTTSVSVEKGQPGQSSNVTVKGGNEIDKTKIPDGKSVTDKSSKSTKKSKFELKPISKKDLLDMRKNKAGTPPWFPGTTPKPIYLASPPWYPGTTHPGATRRPPTEPPKREKVPTPPSGLSAAPDRDLYNKQTKIDFLVTSRYKFNVPNQQSTVSSLSPGQNVPANIKPTVSTDVQTPNSGSNVLPTNQNPLIDSPSQTGSTVTPQQGSKDIPNLGSSKSTKSPPGNDNYVKTNSTLIVNCRTCTCTEGKLVCSGPKCNAGNNSWSPWTEWSPCTAICGKGFRRRFRLCRGYNCKDTSKPAPGIKRFSKTIGIEAEDKSCLVKECSCIFTREFIRIHLGDEEIKRHSIDLGIAWIEKDNRKGLSSPEERVKQDDILKSGETVFMNCSQCKCKNGKMSCSVDCK